MTSRDKNEPPAGGEDIMWNEVEVEVNGYRYVARYSDEAHDQVLVPLLRRIASLHASGGGRTVVFFAGPPAAGKSTVALLLERFAKDVEGCDLQCIGLDGFHHYNDYLRSHTVMRDGVEVSLMAVKGSPESFDAARFAAKLAELKAGGDVAWPVYDRTIHEPRENAVMVTAPIVLIEGNWLLLDEEPWAPLGDLADLTVFLHADEADVRERAIARKSKGGLSHDEAAAHYERSDGPNVHRCLAHSRVADVTIELAPDGDLRLPA